MKWANLLKVALVAFILILVISNCKKEKEEDFAKRFAGNYKGVTYKYIHASDAIPVLLSSYPNSLVSIIRVDAQTITANLTADSLRVVSTCTANSGTLFSYSYSQPIRYIIEPTFISYSCEINGDSLRYTEFLGFAADSNDTRFEFRGSRY